MKQSTLLFLILLLSVPQASAQVTIDLAGGDTALEDNLRAHLRLTKEDCETPDWRVQRLFKLAEKDFQPALRAFGYYQAKVQKHLETTSDCWDATFTIDLGNQVSIRRRSISVSGEAAQDKDMQSLLSSLPLAEGSPLNHGLYEDTKNRLRDFANERGYFDFTITQSRLRVDPALGVADVLIDADSGSRYRFGELRYGALPLNDVFVRRLAKVRQGDFYDSQALVAMDRNLSEGGYFRSVEVRPLLNERENESVPVDVRLKPASRHAWRTGIGFATDTGLRASGGYENRYINPGGHRFESELRLSPVESGLSADYVIPGENPHKESYSFGTSLLHEDNDSAVIDSISLSARHKIKSERWTQTRFIELVTEQSTVGNDYTRSTMVMPGLSFDRSKVDNPLRTSKGYRINLELRGAYDGFLSSMSFLQLRAGGKRIYRFGKSGGRISARANVGITVGDSTQTLPASVRFFAGGDNSVRGYAYKSLGPLDENSLPEGGRHLLTASIEYEHPIVADDWWVAGFMDAGNAFDTQNVALKYGYGVGLRWYSPIGRIRLDVAIPDDTEKDDWRLHFGLGVDL